MYMQNQQCRRNCTHLYHCDVCTFNVWIAMLCCSADHADGTSG